MMMKQILKSKFLGIESPIDMRFLVREIKFYEIKSKFGYRK